MNKLQHIAIIMDGNGRWAEARGEVRTEGHKAGANTAKEIIRHVAEIGIPVLTIWCFSTENWRRPEEEVSLLMELFKDFAKQIDEEFNEKNIRVSFIGRRSALDADLQRIMGEVEGATKDNTGLHLRLAINYSGTQETVDATNRLIAQDAEITDQSLRQEILGDVPDYDLVIRTGGELRTSDFPVRHAELFVTKTFFPALTRDEFDAIIAEYQTRERRLGGIKTTT